MTVSEIINELSVSAREQLAEVPGFPVKIGGMPVRGWGAARTELAEAGVIGPLGGLTTRGAAVTDRIKAQSERF